MKDKTPIKCCPSCYCFCYAAVNLCHHCGYDFKGFCKAYKEVVEHRIIYRAKLSVNGDI